MINRFLKLTLSSTLLLTSLTVNANQTRTLFKCQIEGDATSPGLNSVAKYKELDLIFTKDGEAVEVMNVVLRGQRTTRIDARIGAPKGNSADADSLEVNEKVAPAVPAGTVVFVNQPILNSSPEIRYNSYSMTGGEPVKSDGSVQSSDNRYELRTIVSDFEETLTYDYLYELVYRQYEQNEVTEENDLRYLRNEERKARYAESMARYQQELKAAEGTATTDGKPAVKINPPYLPTLEAEVPFPQSPLDISYTYREYETKQYQPKSFLKVILNSSPIANLECVQTRNLVDNVRAVQDIKGQYNNDPRAKALGKAAITMNRQYRDPWCLQKTLEGTINLAHFNKGNFNVKCEFAGNR